MTPTPTGDTHVNTNLSRRGLGLLARARLTLRAPDRRGAWSGGGLLHQRVVSRAIVEASPQCSDLRITDRKRD